MEPKETADVMELEQRVDALKQSISDYHKEKIMDVREIKKAVVVLEETIRDILQEFENKTGTTVESMYISHDKKEQSEATSYVDEVKINVSI